jgi:hypothetical protein
MGSKDNIIADNYEQAGTPVSPDSELEYSYS